MACGRYKEGNWQQLCRTACGGFACAINFGLPFLVAIAHQNTIAETRRPNSLQMLTPSDVRAYALGVLLSIFLRETA
jgi:hypothetical protein